MEQVFKRILCAIDFDANSFAALDFAATLARQNKARVLLLHVVPTVPEPGNVPPYADVYLNQETRSHELSELAAKHLEKIEHEILVRTGEPSVAILHAAEENSADLIVLAAYRSTGRARRFMGSVTAAVVGQAQCPVLTVRPTWLGDMESVGAQMTKNPVTIGPDATLAEAEDAMRRGGFRMLPVIEKGKLIGVVTDRDLRTRMGRLEETLVRAAMTEDIVTVGPNSSVRQAALTMLDCEVGGMPVVEDGRVVGVITTTDVLKALVR